MVSSDIKRAIEIIEARISSLQQIRNMLLEEFGVDNLKLDSSIAPQNTTSSGSETRKQAVVKLLKAEGPLSRRDIRTKTAFPLGTIAYVLNDKETFKRSKGGKWSVVSEDTKQETASPVLAGEAVRCGRGETQTQRSLKPLRSAERFRVRIPAPAYLLDSQCSNSSSTSYS